ncbi:MAG: GC-type dockerin domain-anchored protein [Planctomycetota bacterium]|nr:GC-type dockerin domain-anchored protein [Planctomycetota bacterium]
MNIKCDRNRTGAGFQADLRLGVVAAVGCLSLSIAAGQPVAATQRAFKQFGWYEGEQALAIGQDAARNVYTAGTRIWAGTTDMLITKHDPSGVQLWQKGFSLGGENRGTAMRVLSDGTVLVVGEAEDVTSGPREVIFMQLATDGSLIASWLIAGTINGDPLHFPQPGPAMDYVESMGAGAIITSYAGRTLLHRFVRGAGGIMMPTMVQEFVFAEPGRFGTIALTDVAFDPSALGPTLVVTGTVRELPGPGSPIPQTDVYVYREPTPFPAPGGFSKRFGRRDAGNLIDPEDFGVGVDINANGNIQIAGRSVTSPFADSLYRASMNGTGIPSSQTVSVASPQITPAYRGLRYSGTQVTTPTTDVLGTVGVTGGRPFLLVETTTSKTAFSPSDSGGALSSVLIDEPIVPIPDTFDGLWAAGEIRYCANTDLYLLSAPTPTAFNCGLPLAYATTPLTYNENVRVNVVPFDEVPAIRVDYSIYTHSLVQQNACAECPEVAFPLKLNELVVWNNAAADTSEFSELKGLPGADLSSVAVIEIDGRAASAGVVTKVDVVPLGRLLPADGYYVIGDVRIANLDQVFSGAPGTQRYLNATATYYLLRPFSGVDPAPFATYFNSLLGTDLDATNDGVLDVNFSSICSVQDVVAVTDGAVGALTYAPASLVIGPKFVDYPCSTIAVDRSHPPGIFRPGDYPRNWATTTFTNFDERHPLGNVATPGALNLGETDEAGYQVRGIDTRGFGGVDWRFANALLVDTGTPLPGQTPGVEFHAGEVKGVTFTWFRPENPAGCPGATFRIADDRAYGISFVPTGAGATTWSLVPGPAFASPSATIEVLNGGSVVATASSSGGLPSLSFNATPLREVKVALSIDTSGATYELTWPSNRNFVLGGTSTPGTVVRIKLPGVACASLSPLRVSGLVTGFQIRRMSVTPGPCAAPPPPGAIGTTVAGLGSGIISGQSGGVLLSGLISAGDGLAVIPDAPAPGLTLAISDANGGPDFISIDDVLDVVASGSINAQPPTELARASLRRTATGIAASFDFEPAFTQSGAVFRVGYTNASNDYVSIFSGSNLTTVVEVTGNGPGSPIDLTQGIGWLDSSAGQLGPNTPLNFYLCGATNGPVTVIIDGVAYQVNEAFGVKLLVGVDHGGTLPASILEAAVTRGGTSPQPFPPILISNIAVPNPCPADFNGDGQVDFFDYLDYSLAYSQEDPSADLNGDGQVDFFDFLDFAVAFDEGCE